VGVWMRGVGGVVCVGWRWGVGFEGELIGGGGRGGGCV